VVLDPAEKERVRYHMGYLEVSPAAAITFGIPAPIQTLFLLESAMDRIMPVAEDRVRKLITILDSIECKEEGGLDYLVVSRVSDIELRPDHIEKLEEQYAKWASKLADTLGAPLYPGSSKFRSLFGVGGPNQAGSIPVRS
jgi:hypothetical protein